MWHVSYLALPFKEGISKPAPKQLPECPLHGPLRQLGKPHAPATPHLTGAPLLTASPCPPSASVLPQPPSCSRPWDSDLRKSRHKELGTLLPLAERLTGRNRLFKLPT